MSEQTTETWYVGLNPGPIVYNQYGTQIADCRSVSNTQNYNKSNAIFIAAAPETKRQRDALLAALRKSHAMIARLEGHLQAIGEWGDEEQDIIEANQSALAAAKEVQS